MFTHYKIQIRADLIWGCREVFLNLQTGSSRGTSLNLEILQTFLQWAVLEQKKHVI